MVNSARGIQTVTTLQIRQSRCPLDGPPPPFQPVATTTPVHYSTMVKSPAGEETILVNSAAATPPTPTHQAHPSTSVAIAE